jgi:small nuclear ribonucleoprotein (snRNP)-like protein
MLDELIGQTVVIDLRSHYVCLGVLHAADEQFLDLRKADLHDLRDTHTTRENYIAEAVRTGVKKNRRRVLLVRDEVIAIARIEDVVFQ